MDTVTRKHDATRVHFGMAGHSIQKRRHFNRRAERFLIQRYRPAWNLCLEGFGIHDPGKGRRQGEVSLWDLMHPGRSWGAKLRQTRAAKDAIDDLRKFLAAAEAKKAE